MRKVLPAGGYPLVEIPMAPPAVSHAFPVDASRRFRRSTSGVESAAPPRSEGPTAASPHARAILDEHGRVLVLITHNTDYGDAFERESDDPNYFLAFSVDGYAFGINVLLYAMSH